jgi:hypothetical protein
MRQRDASIWLRLWMAIKAHRIISLDFIDRDLVGRQIWSKRFVGFESLLRLVK